MGQKRKLKGNSNVLQEKSQINHFSYQVKNQQQKQEQTKSKISKRGKHKNTTKIRVEINERKNNSETGEIKADSLGTQGLPGGSVVKNLPANAGDVGDTGLIPRWGRSPGVGNGNPLPYSFLKNPMER